MDALQLAVQPLVGRSFAAAEDHPESYVAIVSYGFSTEQFGAAAAAIGQTVQLDRMPYRIAGVMPPPVGRGRPA